MVIRWGFIVIYFVWFVFLDLWCDIRVYSMDVYKVKLIVKVMIYNFYVSCYKIDFWLVYFNLVVNEVIWLWIVFIYLLNIVLDDVEVIIY